MADDAVVTTSELELAERYRIYRWGLVAIAVLLGMLVLAVPLSQIATITASFAGEDTNVDVQLVGTVSVGLAVSIGFGGTAMIRVIRRQKADLKRLRARVDHLERQLDARGD